MQSFQKQATIIKSALNPVRFPVMAEKVKRRFFSPKSTFSTDAYKAWLIQNSVTVNEWCAGMDESLWAETQEFVAGLFNRYEKIQQTLPVNLGGNACVRLLYFLTRFYKPGTVVETGVALGFSSQSFLSAMQLNGKGKLYSSDFPYFRIPDAEKYVGIVVEERLKKDWKLYSEGDDRNLPAIMREINTIDLFHYDSDKTYAGRNKGYDAVKSKLSDNAIIIFDDIQDNPHFHDFIQMYQIKNWQVLENRDGGYVGLIDNKKAR